jgi:hypothetical protein
METGYPAVIAVLRDYFDGLYHSDTMRLARAFHPRAQYVSVSNGTLLYRTMPDYFAVVDVRPSPASRLEVRRDEIVSVSFAGPLTATAVVRCAIADKSFTDCLTLICLDGRWQIISKVFHAEPRS